MGTLIVLVLVAVAGWVVWKLLKSPDANNDGVVDHKDVVHAVKEVAEEVKHEVKEVAAEVTTKVKKGRKKKAQ
jgi:predicted negative regulator of RcsB-dependent stress response